MSCECYTIGGPWVTYDPDCPAHGIQAQEDQRIREERERELLNEVNRLREIVGQQELRIRTLERANTRYK